MPSKTIYQLPITNYQLTITKYAYSGENYLDFDF